MALFVQRTIFLWFIIFSHQQEIYDFYFLHPYWPLNYSPPEPLLVRPLKRRFRYGSGTVQQRRGSGVEWGGQGRKLVAEFGLFTNMYKQKEVPLFISRPVNCKSNWWMETEKTGIGTLLYHCIWLKAPTYSFPGVCINNRSIICHFSDRTVGSIFSKNKVYYFGRLIISSTFAAVLSDITYQERLREMALWSLSNRPGAYRGMVLHPSLPEQG